MNDEFLGFLRRIGAGTFLRPISELVNPVYLEIAFWVLVILVFGWYHWRGAVTVDWTNRTSDNFRRSAAAELVVGAIVVAITAVLISTPLPT